MDPVLTSFTDIWSAALCRMSTASCRAVRIYHRPYDNGRRETRRPHIGMSVNQPGYGSFVWTDSVGLTWLRLDDG